VYWVPETTLTALISLQLVTIFVTAAAGVKKVATRKIPTSDARNERSIVGE
jgi:hypothetical protein